MNSSIGIPLLFVFLWSSGYIATEFSSTHIEPATFVLVRTTITALVFLLIVLVTKSSWPTRWEDFSHSIVVGILMHGVYSAGFFAAIFHGVDVVLCALILGLQPILTTLLSSVFLGEKITTRKSCGFLAGLVGVSIVILERNPGQLTLQYASDLGARNDFTAISLCFTSLLAISIATIVQKRHCSAVQPMPGVCIQYTAAAIFIAPFAMTLETLQIDWNLSFVLSLGWLVIFVSVGAMSLLMILLKRGEAGSVANLFYLVTPLVAVEAWILFDETITLIALGGMLLCMAGVYVVNNAPATKPGAAAARSNGSAIGGFVFRNIRVRVDYVSR